MTDPTPSIGTSSCPCTGKSTDEKWDEIRCPICMDYPHNAVQLSCTSVNCRCFICNTSHRHSNCLDRFKRPPIQNDTNNNTEEIVMHLKCPLCRGDVTGWAINEDARQCMDKKSRDCSRDKCEFHGNYEELRSHARRDHPLNRPAEVDPLRQRQWRRFEQQQELGDVMSAIRSEIPGAVVVGDYAVEADEVSSLDDVTTGDSEGSGSLWTTLVLGPVIRSPITSSLEESRELHVETSTAHHGRRRRPRYLWGEILLGLQYDDGGAGGSDSRDDGDVHDNDAGDNNTRVVRRRLNDYDGTFARIRHPDGNDNRDGNAIQQEDIEAADVEYTDADHTGDDGDDDDDHDSDDGTDMPSRW